jgi:hypothetical protein
MRSISMIYREISEVLLLLVLWKRGRCPKGLIELVGKLEKAKRSGYIAL